VSGGTVAGDAADAAYRRDDRYHQQADEYEAAAWKLDGMAQDVVVLHRLGLDLATRAPGRTIARPPSSAPCATASAARRGRGGRGVGGCHASHPAPRAGRDGTRSFVDSYSSARSRAERGSRGRPVRGAPSPSHGVCAWRPLEQAAVDALVTECAICHTFVRRRAPSGGDAGRRRGPSMPRFERVPTARPVGPSPQVPHAPSDQRSAGSYHAALPRSPPHPAHRRRRAPALRIVRCWSRARSRRLRRRGDRAGRRRPIVSAGPRRERAGALARRARQRSRGRRPQAR
jgi:hypothetical protein